MNDRHLTPTLVSQLKSVVHETTYLPDETAVLLDTARSRVVTLSETATFIVKRIQSGDDPDVTALANELACEFDVDANVALRDIRTFLNELRETLEARTS